MRVTREIGVEGQDLAKVRLARGSGEASEPTLEVVVEIVDVDCFALEIVVVGLEILSVTHEDTRRSAVLTHHERQQIIEAVAATTAQEWAEIIP